MVRHPWRGRWSISDNVIRLNGLYELASRRALSGQMSRRAARSRQQDAELRDNAAGMTEAEGLNSPATWADHSLGSHARKQQTTAFGLRNADIAELHAFGRHNSPLGHVSLATTGSYLVTLYSANDAHGEDLARMFRMEESV